ncbi:hypothetical protein NK214_06950 [Chromobacterium sp. S0633]|uniref:hypothetical protein n=1 Tax=Chromobacterium sp. S0633 TaxID=2957805 RepID=UPI0020A09A7E|nr:hypothetical protein [Chromobacterium sp. S0633]MCP1289929.1 hypothetical protein [Chromobacterium sp. S0633]
MELVQEDWDEAAKAQYSEIQNRVISGLKLQFGEHNIQSKVENFIELGNKPFSVAAFHNKFLEQIRNSYVIGSYYPALTGACALGERILNHLMILLREYHKSSSEYKKVYKKDSFDNWLQAIDALESWRELLPEAALKFRDLNEKRNRAIHFNPETDRDDKSLAIEAIHLLQEIVSTQFSAFGNQPWYFCVPGENYIKKEWEERPFVKCVLIPNASLVGPKHRVESIVPKLMINDQFDYEEKCISDDDFIFLRQMG